MTLQKEHSLLIANILSDQDLENLRNHALRREAVGESSQLRPSTLNLRTLLASSSFRRGLWQQKRVIGLPRRKKLGEVFLMDITNFQAREQIYQTPNGRPQSFPSGAEAAGPILNFFLELGNNSVMSALSNYISVLPHIRPAIGAAVGLLFSLLYGLFVFMLNLNCVEAPLLKEGDVVLTLLKDVKIDIEIDTELSGGGIAEKRCEILLGDCVLGCIKQNKDSEVLDSIQLFGDVFLLVSKNLSAAISPLTFDLLNQAILKGRVKVVGKSFVDTKESINSRGVSNLGDIAEPSTGEPPFLLPTTGEFHEQERVIIDQTYNWNLHPRKENVILKINGSLLQPSEITSGYSEDFAFFHLYFTYTNQPRSLPRIPILVPVINWRQNWAQAKIGFKERAVNRTQVFLKKAKRYVRVPDAVNPSNGDNTLLIGVSIQSFINFVLFLFFDENIQINFDADDGPEFVQVSQLEELDEATTNLDIFEFPGKKNPEILEVNRIEASIQPNKLEFSELEKEVFLEKGPELCESTPLNHFENDCLEIESDWGSESENEW